LLVRNLKEQATKHKKLLLAMKLTSIILLSACLTASATGLTQTVTLNFKKAPLEKVLTEIKKQTGYSIFYNYRLIDKARPVTISVKNAGIDEVMKACLIDLALYYEFADRSLFIKEMGGLSPDGGGGSDQGELTGVDRLPIDIHGRVVNEKGVPVAASIVVKGTNKGTSTNDNGEFELKGIGDDAVLVISGVSIESFEVKVNGRSELALGAKIKSSVGEEVIINKGYYSVRQKENTGNVAIINGADISKQPVSNVLAALEGRVPGLVITQTTGVPGGAFNVQLRGKGSIANGNNPLVIIDGIPYPSTRLGSVYTSSITGGGSPLNNINPEDIEKVEVLKDADATAIYGSRGANGVILITTKTGKSN
jgi:TonB-dependent SusC/RagA subfamily outer membrane receptor